MARHNRERPLSHDRRPSPKSTYVTLELPAPAFRNPNLIPIVSRHSNTAAATVPAWERERGYQQRHDEPKGERLPQIWRPDIDDLIRRTTHDYDLITNYERDAEGGQRWLTDDIARIRDIGRHLHGDVSALRRWQRVVANEGDQDKLMMQRIKSEANVVKLLCERVQRAINKYEQKCRWELLRDGVYAQDEDGKLYKPIAPQQYLSEGGFLHIPVRYSPEIIEEDIMSNDRSASHLEERQADTRRNMEESPTARDARYSPRHSSERNLAFESVSQQSSNDGTSRNVRQGSSHRREAVREGRIAKRSRTPPYDRNRRSMSPKYYDHYPGSDVSPQRRPTYERAYSRSHNSVRERNGLSRREAKREAARERRPSQIVGRLGNHVLRF